MGSSDKLDHGESARVAAAMPSTPRARSARYGCDGEDVEDAARREVFRPLVWRVPTSVGTVAACGFAGVLYKVVTSTQVVGWLTKVIGRVLNTAF